MNHVYFMFIKTDKQYHSILSYSVYYYIFINAHP